MLWVLKRTVSRRRFFWSPKTYVKTDGWENIYSFTLNIFVYLNLWWCAKKVTIEQWQTASVMFYIRLFHLEQSDLDLHCLLRPICLNVNARFYLSYGPRRDKTCLQGFSTKWDSNQPAQLQRLARKLNFVVARLDMILSNKWITKALIRLHGCAGWSAPLLFANPRRQVFTGRGPYDIKIF